MQCAYAVLYCPLWPVQLYHIFPHHPIKVTIFGKKLLHIKCAFLFSLELLSETFLILRRNERNITINVHHTRYQLDLDRPVSARLKADSHIICCALAVPLPYRSLIHTCHAAPLPCSDSAVSFVKVRVVAGNIRTASPTV
jgi:hypothetical protein